MPTGVAAHAALSPAVLAGRLREWGVTFPARILAHYPHRAVRVALDSLDEESRAGQLPPLHNPGGFTARRIQAAAEYPESLEPKRPGRPRTPAEDRDAVMRRYVERQGGLGDARMSDEAIQLYMARQKARGNR